MSQCGFGDPEIVRADDFTSGRELSPDVGVNASDLFGDLERPHPGKQMLDECAATRALGAVGAVDTVQEFADRDHADRTVLLTEGGINLRVSDDQVVPGAVLSRRGISCSASRQAECADCVPMNWRSRTRHRRASAAESSPEGLRVSPTVGRDVDRFHRGDSRGQPAELLAVLPRRTGRQHGSHEGAARRGWLHGHRDIGQVLSSSISDRRLATPSL